MTRWARYAGYVAQALILGTLLFVALVQLLKLGSGATVFRYQGF